MECSLAQFVVFVSKTAHLFLHFECCEVVCPLCIQVSIFLHYLSKVWSESIGLCQLLLRNLLVLTLSQCCDVFAVSRSVPRSM